MTCASDDEWLLIKALGAYRYAPSGKLCAARCSKALEWLDWDTQAAKASFEMLRHLENTISTAVSLRLAAHYKRADWWSAPKLELTKATQGMIIEAEDRVTKKGLHLTAANIERELMLGFWVSIMGSGIDYETQLWRPMKPAFPGYRGKRKGLMTQLNYLRLLRNAISHHEPVGGRHLEADRQSILSAIRFVSPQAEVWVAGRETLGALVKTNPGACPRIGTTSTEEGR